MDTYHSMDELKNIDKKKIHILKALIKKCETEIKYWLELKNSFEELSKLNGKELLSQFANQLYKMSKDMVRGDFNTRRWYIRNEKMLIFDNILSIANKHIEMKAIGKTWLNLFMTFLTAIIIDIHGKVPEQQLEKEIENMFKEIYSTSINELISILKSSTNMNETIEKLMEEENMIDINPISTIYCIFIASLYNTETKRDTLSKQLYSMLMYDNHSHILCSTPYGCSSAHIHGGIHYQEWENSY